MPALPQGSRAGAGAIPARSLEGHKPGKASPDTALPSPPPPQGGGSSHDITGKAGPGASPYPALSRRHPMHRTVVAMCDKKLYRGLRVDPPSYPFETYLPWHASLVTGVV